MKASELAVKYRVAEDGEIDDNGISSAEWQVQGNVHAPGRITYWKYVCSTDDKETAQRIATALRHHEALVDLAKRATCRDPKTILGECLRCGSGSCASAQELLATIEREGQS